MRKRWLLLLLVLAPLLAVALAVANFNAYLRDNRDWLAQQASARLGRPVKFDAIGISLRDGLGARVTGVSIGGDAARGEEELLRVARADVAVRILPALRGRYEIRRIVLDAPQITVVRGPRGFNSASVGAPPAPPSAAARAPAAGAARADGGIALLISLLQVKNGNVRFIDRTTAPAAEMVVERLEFAASELSLDRRVAIEGKAAILGAEEQNLRISGSVGPLGDLKALPSAPLDLQVHLGALAIDRIKANALAGRLIPPQLFSSDPIEVAAQIGGTLAAWRGVARLDASDVAISYGNHLRKARGVELRVEVEAEWSAGGFEVDKVELRLAQAHLRGRGRIGATGQELDFEVSGSGIPLDGWESIAPAAAAFEAGGALDLQVRATGRGGAGAAPVLSGTIALREARWAHKRAPLRVEGLNTVIALRGDRAEIPATDFKLNGKPVRVAATVESLRDRAATFLLESPELPLGALGIGAADTGAKEFAKGVEVRGNFRAAGDGPRAKLTVRSTSGIVRDVRYADLAGVATLRDEKVTLERISVAAFGGSLAGAGTYVLGAAPAFSFRGAIDGIDLAALTARFAPDGDVRMTGELHADLDVRGRGANRETVERALVGQGVARVEGGVLQGVNLADEALRSLTGLKGLSSLISPALRKKYPEVFAGKDTVFETLESHMTLADGVAAIDRAALVAPDYRLNGKGTIGLDNTVDLAARFTASADLTQDLLGAAQPLEFLTDGEGHFEVPVRLVGSLPSIRVRPDVPYIARRLAGALVQSGIEEGLNALVGKKKRGPSPNGTPRRDEKPAEELIRKGLEGLFGSPRRERDEGGR